MNSEGAPLMRGFRMSGFTVNFGRLISIREAKPVKEKVVPMIHVPDVRATMEWYASIGFTVVRCNEEDGQVDWALLTFGSSELMLSLGGKPSTAFRREVDLYTNVDNVDSLFLLLKDKVEVVEEPHDTFYGMREFIIRDLNRFWVTFGQPIEA